MGCRRYRLAAALLTLIGTSPVAAAEKTMADVMADWPTMIGQRLILEGAYVILAEPGIAMVDSSAGNILVWGPFKDREDVRYLLTYCTDVRPPKDRCTMYLEGTIMQSSGAEPQLKDVDFRPPK